MTDLNVGLLVTGGVRLGGVNSRTCVRWLFLGGVDRTEASGFSKLAWDLRWGELDLCPSELDLCKGEADLCKVELDL